MKYLQRSPVRRQSRTVDALAPLVPIDTTHASNSAQGVSLSDAASPPTWRHVVRHRVREGLASVADPNAITRNLWFHPVAGRLDKATTIIRGAAR